jgi:hypothetical protein
MGSRLLEEKDYLRYNGDMDFAIPIEHKNSSGIYSVTNKLNGNKHTIGHKNHLGHKHSLETRLKMKNSQKLRWSVKSCLSFP